jgi:hypothetical protein
MPTRYLTIGPLPYNSTEAQRIAMLARLAAGPATAEQLMADCNAPCPTKRISELRRMGYPIHTDIADRLNAGGSVNRVGLYSLLQPDTRQPDLFT